jgi:DNA-binding GntR family transcriptional regulator
MFPVPSMPTGPWPVIGNHSLDSPSSALAKAINARDADEAARLCAEHVRNAGRTGMAELKRQDSALLA